MISSHAAFCAVIISSFLFVPVVRSATLEVGPGKAYTMPSQAIAAATHGDTILIDSAGVYDGDVAAIGINDLTIRGVGKGRALLDSKGRTARRKGIFAVKGDNLTVENIEFRNATDEVNAAGIRAQGNGLTVRNCRFFECHDAILGGAGDVLIEYSEFSHCGHSSSPATHNLYMSENVDKLTYQHNYSTHTYEGHLLKSRAKESWILYNRITDETGLGSAVTDFPNGGVVVMIGNILHKGPKGKNNRLIAYGMEGITHEKNSLHVINNTLWFQHRRRGWFIRTEKVAGDFVTITRNNILVGGMPLVKNGGSDSKGDLFFDSIEGPGFVDPGHYDFRPTAGAACIDAGVTPGRLGDFDLAPVYQYVHSHGREARVLKGRLDVGAYEF